MDFNEVCESEVYYLREKIECQFIIMREMYKAKRRLPNSEEWAKMNYLLNQVENLTRRMERISSRLDRGMTLDEARVGTVIFGWTEAKLSDLSERTLKRAWENLWEMYASITEPKEGNYR